LKAGIGPPRITSVANWHSSRATGQIPVLIRAAQAAKAPLRITPVV